MMEVFITYKADIEGRIDPNPYHPVRMVELSKIKNFKGKVEKLGEIVTFAQVIVSENPKQLPYIGLENIESGTGFYCQANSKYDFSTAVYFEENLILFPKLRPYLNKVFFSTFKGCASTEFYVLKAKKCEPKYLYYFLQSDTVVNQTSFLMTGNTLPRLQTEDVKNLLIPIPNNETQQKVIHIMDTAYTKKKQNEEEAERLLNSYIELINEFIDIDLNSSTQRKIFYICFEELEGALNPERYANRITLDSKHAWIQIKDIGDIIRDTFTPARTNPEDDYGLIRIDDLDNNPQDAVIRDVKGNAINGIILQVQENDILVARLGPTLENKKTIITPSYDKELISSNEFICLRCREKVNPVFVLVFLKTDFYKNLTMQKSRGATPSRRRLSHEDFAELPFPDIAKPLQDKIANKFIENVNRAKALNKEAAEALEQAKKEVEQILFE